MAMRELSRRARVMVEVLCQNSHTVERIVHSKVRARRLPVVR